MPSVKLTAPTGPRTGVTTSSCVNARGLWPARYSTARAMSAMSALSFSGRPAIIAAVFGESIVASTTSSATWTPSARSSCAAAWTKARVAAAPAAHRPRPGIARRAEPPVTWISVPAPARTPSLRNTKACSATAPVQPRKSSTDASPSGPPPNGPGFVGRAALTALTIRSSRPNSARARSSASRNDVRIRRVGRDRHAAGGADGLERLRRVRDRRAAPAVVQVMAEDRAAEVAGAEDDEGRHDLILRTRRIGNCATPIPATTSSAPATARTVTTSSRISAPSASAPNGMIIEMKETVTVGNSRIRTVSVTNVKPVPSTAR